MKKIIFIVFINVALFAQNVQTPNEAEKQERTMFFGAGIGYVNIIKAQIGWQINREFSVALISNMYPEGEGTQMGAVSVVGLKASYYLDKNFTFMKFNSINCEFGYWKSSVPLHSFEITLSREGISKECINGYYSIGLGVYTNNSKKTIFGPSLKVGFNINK